MPVSPLLPNVDSHIGTPGMPGRDTMPAAAWSTAEDYPQKDELQAAPWLGLHYANEFS
ncbi:hypothetical protein ABH924_001773 [Arthrobacter sp. GAS37]